MAIKFVTCLLVLLTFFCSGIYSQGYVFKVLATKGESLSNTNGSWKPVKTGMELKSNDSLKVKPNAYIGLVDKLGYPLELKSAGTYSINELNSKIGRKPSVVIKYLKFIVSSNSKEGKKTLTAVGGVVREIGDLNIQLPDSTNYFYGDSLCINWKAKIPGPYTVSIKNMYNETLLIEQVSDTLVTLNMTRHKLRTDSIFNIEFRGQKGVTAQTKNVSARIFKKLSAKKKVALNALLANLTTQYEKNSVVGFLIRASLFEQNHLFADANTEYIKAIKLYQMAGLEYYYNEFLQRINM